MGVDIALMRFFDACAEKGPLTGPMLALGSLNIQETPEAIAAYAARNNYARLADRQDVASLFGDRYGVRGYQSCDINGEADLFLDLSQPLAREYHGAFRSILNGGTLEHIFDLRQAMQNIHDATAVGGLMLHTLPMTWMNHGFVNLNPVLFHLAAEANAYDVVAEGFYFSAGTWPGQNAPVVTLEGVDEVVPGLDRSARAVLAERHVPALVMHLIALRKTRDEAFRVPTQVS